MSLIPTTILTGFLGSGKTTLLKRVLTEAAGREARASRHDPASWALRPTVAPFRLLTRGEQRPGEAETRSNPRARSARLRAIIRLEGLPA